MTFVALLLDFREAFQAETRDFFHVLLPVFQLRHSVFQVQLRGHRTKEAIWEKQAEYLVGLLAGCYGQSSWRHKQQL